MASLCLSEYSKQLEDYTKQEEIITIMCRTIIAKLQWLDNESRQLQDLEHCGNTWMDVLKCKL